MGRPRMNAPMKTLRSDARRNRERVLVAARELFAERGLAAQMDEIAERAGVGLGTVYRHFPTKEQLAAELVAEAFERLAAQAQHALAADGSAWDRLIRALRANLAELEGDAGARAAIANTRTAAFEIFEPALTRHSQVLGELMGAAHDEGTLRRDFGANDLGMLLCGVSAAIDSRSYIGWQRQLSFALDGLRTPPAQHEILRQI